MIKTKAVAPWKFAAVDHQSGSSGTTVHSSTAGATAANTTSTTKELPKKRRFLGLNTIAGNISAKNSFILDQA